MFPFFLSPFSRDIVFSINYTLSREEKYNQYDYLICNISIDYDFPIKLLNNDNQYINHVYVLHVDPIFRRWDLVGQLKE